jgi:predicted RNase H-like nuclease
MKIIGFDCAAQMDKVGITYSEFTANKWKIEKILPKANYDKFLKKIEYFKEREEEVLLCFDTPLGYPQKMVAYLNKLTAGKADLGNEFNYDDHSREYFRRRTDILVKNELGITPLEIGADKLARSTLRTFEIINRINKILNGELSLAWDNKNLSQYSMIEVYPKATLVGLKKFAGYQFPVGRKKKPKQKNYMSFKKDIDAKKKVLKIILKECTNPEDIDIPEKIKPKFEHGFDSLICAFTGKKFIDGKLNSPSDFGLDNDMKEGWIWTKLKK